jgi:hypothetical protein
MCAGQLLHNRSKVHPDVFAEAMTVAKDVCGCTARQAEEASRWAAQAILRAALEKTKRRT